MGVQPKEQVQHCASATRPLTEGLKLRKRKKKNLYLRPKFFTKCLYSVGKRNVYLSMGKSLV